MRFWYLWRMRLVAFAVMPAAICCALPRTAEAQRLAWQQTRLDESARYYGSRDKLELAGADTQSSTAPAARAILARLKAMRYEKVAPSCEAFLAGGGSADVILPLLYDPVDPVRGGAATALATSRDKKVALEMVHALKTFDARGFKGGTQMLNMRMEARVAFQKALSEITDVPFNPADPWSWKLNAIEDAIAKMGGP